jgi:hypothetical protein
VIWRAIWSRVSFSFVKETFLDKERDRYEGELGGQISLSLMQKPDTMDEFGLYCALVEKTCVEHDVRALHLRGPESLHRMFPDVYRFATVERLREVQNKVPYLDVLLAVALYYVVGLWEKIDHLDWSKLKPESRKEIERLLRQGLEWMNNEEYTRLSLIVPYLKKEIV